MLTLGIYAGKAPFGQLPIYEEPGLVLAQSAAIARHVARQHGYYGETSHDAALIDQALEGVADIVTRLVQALFLPLPDDKRAEAKASLLNEFLPAQFAIYSKLLEKNGNNGHLVGSKASSMAWRLASESRPTWPATSTPRKSNKGAATRPCCYQLASTQLAWHEPGAMKKTHTRCPQTR